MPLDHPILFVYSKPTHLSIHYRGTTGTDHLLERIHLFTCPSDLIGPSGATHPFLVHIKRYFDE